MDRVYDKIQKGMYEPEIEMIDRPSGPLSAETVAVIDQVNNLHKRQRMIGNEQFLNDLQRELDIPDDIWDNFIHCARSWAGDHEAAMRSRGRETVDVRILILEKAVELEALTQNSRERNGHE